jgi:hypothetical protein
MKIKTFARGIEGIINFFFDMMLLAGLIKVLVLNNFILDCLSSGLLA